MGCKEMVEIGSAFAAVFVGHCFADYPLQNDWMALNKQKRGLLGWVSCITHCLIYTICISLALWLVKYDLTLKTAVLILFSHLIFDRFELINKWMKIYGKTNWMDNLPSTIGGFIKWDYDHMTVEEIVKTNFSTFVYIMTDLACHFVLLFLILIYSS